MTFKLVTLGWCLLVAVSPSWSHGGEDHDHADTPAVSSPTGAAMPRATTRTESFELVATLSDPDKPNPTLTLYVDRFASNQPLEGATIEVESGNFQATAKAMSAGVYEVAGQAFVKPGHYPLTVSIQAGDDSDLLDVTLDTEAHDGPLAAESASSTTPAWRRPALSVIAALAAMLLFIGGRRAYRRRANPHAKQP